MNSGVGGGDSSVGTQDSTFPHPATPPGHQQQAYFCRLTPYIIKEIVGYGALMVFFEQFKVFQFSVCRGMNVLQLASRKSGVWRRKLSIAISSV